jgi:hypothetical protein
VYRSPHLGFNRSEQRLLLCALGGETDADLSRILSVSLPAVKNVWASIYRRVSRQMPELIADPFLSEDAEALRRGKEKKRRLLAWLREHPEELRPVSRRLLRQAATC